jgi:hypothetical protein
MPNSTATRRRALFIQVVDQVNDVPKVNRGIAVTISGLLWVRCRTVLIQIVHQKDHVSDIHYPIASAVSADESLDSLSDQ